jgi:hypothetical protein
MIACLRRDDSTTNAMDIMPVIRSRGGSGPRIRRYHQKLIENFHTKCKYCWFDGLILLLVLLVPSSTDNRPTEPGGNEHLEIISSGRPL